MNKILNQRGLLVAMILTASLIGILVYVERTRPASLIFERVSRVKIGDTLQGVESILGPPHFVDSNQELWYLYRVEGASDPYKIRFDSAGRVAWTSF